VLWSGKRTLLVELEGHGREGIVEDVDLSRTVGWFTTIFPVLLDLGEVVEPREALQAVQAQVRGIPQRGIGFGLLRYLCEENDVRQHMQALPRAEVNFNYLGQLDQTLAEAMPFRRAQESTGPERSWRSTRSHLLYIVGLIGGGKLYLRWSYSKNQYRRETIERLASNCAEALRGLITHCLPCQGF
jgi:non-ribosomal peptide synthase protein (TIGR01720 family)